MIINLRELKKASKLVIGDEYLLKNQSVIGLYLGYNAYVNYFLVLHPFKQGRWSVDKDNYYYNRLVDIKDAYKKTIPNLLNCPIVPIYGRRNSNIVKIAQNSNGVTDQKEGYILMTNIVRNIFRQIRDISTKGTSSKAIASLMLSRLPIELCNLNEVGMLTISEDLDEPSLVSLNQNNAYKIAKDNGGIIDQSLTNIFEKVKIGRIIKRVSGEMFDNVEIERFTHLFNSYVIQASKYEISIVKGDDIVKYYDTKSYDHSEHGTLQNSCMRYDRCANQAKFYAVHPNCSMVILTKNGKLRGRALLWNLHDGKKYLDRIYYTLDSEVPMFEKWSKEQNIDYFHYERGSEGSKETLFVKTPFDQMAQVKNLTIPWIDSFREISLDFKYMISKGNLNHPSYMTLDVGRLYYGNGHQNFTNCGEVLDYLSEFKSKRIPLGKVSVCNYLNPNEKYANEEDCVFIMNGYAKYFLKTHVNEKGLPLSTTELKAKFSEPNKVQAKQLAIEDMPF